MARVSLTVMVLGIAGVASARTRGHLSRTVAVTAPGSRRRLDTATVPLNGVWEEDTWRDMKTNITFCQFGQLEVGMTDGTILRDDAATVDIVVNEPTCLCYLYGKSAFLHSETALDACTDDYCQSVTPGAGEWPNHAESRTAMSVVKASGTDNGTPFWALLMNIDDLEGGRIYGSKFGFAVSTESEPNLEESMGSFVQFGPKMVRTGNVTCPAASDDDDDDGSVVGDDDGSSDTFWAFGSYKTSGKTTENLVGICPKNEDEGRSEDYYKLETLNEESSPRRDLEFDISVESMRSFDRPELSNKGICACDCAGTIVTTMVDSCTMNCLQSCRATDESCSVASSSTCSTIQNFMCLEVGGQNCAVMKTSNKFMIVPSSGSCPSPEEVLVEGGEWTRTTEPEDDACEDGAIPVASLPAVAVALLSMLALVCGLSVEN